MDDLKKENLFTEQGRDTPVPVDVVVVDQATLDRQQTSGTDYVQKNPFGRKDRLYRSPVRARTSSSGSVPDLTEQTTRISQTKSDISERPKRSRTEDEDEQELQIFKEMLEKLTNKSKELNLFIEQTTNTKSEIKKAARDIKWQLECITKRLKEHQSQPSKIKATEESKSTKYPETKTDAKKVQTQSRGIQTVEIVERMEEKEVEIIQKQIEEGKGFEELTTIIDNEWPEEVYRTVYTNLGNPLKANLKNDIVIVIDPNEDGEKGIIKELIGKYPAIKDILEGGCSEGKIEYVRNETKTSRKKEETERQTVFLLPYTVNKKEINDMEKFYKIIKTLKTELDISGEKEKEIILLTPEGLNRNYTRKLTEYALHGGGIKVNYMIPKAIGRGGQKKLPGKSTERFKDDAIVIKTNGKSYADILNTVKQTVNIEQTDVKIKTIRKTKTGDLLMTVEKENGKIDILKKTIENKIENVTVQIGGNPKATVFIKNIDAVTVKEEVQKSIIKEASLEQNEYIEIVKLIKNQRENQTAIVETTKKTADKLTKLGNIRIGWVLCNITPRKQVTKCKNCWSYSHTTKNCNSPSKKNCCNKCAQEGHIAKICTNEFFCPLCNEKGHRHDRGGCKQYKKAMYNATTRN